MINRIPFVPFPLPIVRTIVKPLYGIGEKILRFFPGLSTKLIQADIDMQAREYLSIAFFSLWFWTALTFSLFFILFLLVNVPENFIYFMTLLPVFMGLVSFMYINLYPDLIISKKIRELEKNLLFALRHLQIQVKSGIPLFDGLVSISQGNYGLISNEFRDCVKKISTGEPEINSLEELVFKNPSIFFRRVIWQISNAMRTGADLGNTLDAIVDNLSNEQKVAIRRYGSQLNPLSMMYMMTAVIMPSLGITFLILLSTFSGMPISEFLFWFILCILIVFQFSFVGVVKSRRPTIEL